MRKLSARAESAFIKPFLAMEILERAKQLQQQGRKVYRMEVGEPDFKTPEVVVDAAIDALRSGETKYCSTLGILPLREALVSRYKSEYGVEISTDQIIITSGSSAAMMLLFSLLFDPGDEVLLPDPYYACYPNFLKLYGVNIKYIPLYPENQFRLTVDDVKKAVSDKTKAIIINSPANPTGQLCPDEVFEFLAGENITIISDEIYHGLIYGGKHARSSLEFTENTFVISGFSKLFAMTGWRLGYIIAPLDWMKLLKHGQQNFFIAANTFVQFGALAALSHSQSITDNVVSVFEHRREILLGELEHIGIKTAYKPDGAFYLLVDFKQYNDDSLALAMDILEKTGVALTPGLDFGNQVKTYLRFSYAASVPDIIGAIKLLKGYLDQIK